MLNNWLRLALRNFWKNRISSIINVSGLTIGLCSCLLIALYVRHELNYDAFEEKGDRIARVIMEYKFDGGKETKRGNFTSTKVAPALSRNFPEVLAAVRMDDSRPVVSYGERLFRDNVFMYADSAFFEVFSMPLLRGDAQSALSGKYKLVLTESAARQYFGNEDPMGKTMRVGTDGLSYEVTGLMRDCPANSQIKFGMLASFSSLGANQEETYFEANYTTFLLLKDPSSFATLQAKLGPFMKKEMAGKGARIDFFLEPFLRIHLYSEYTGFEPGGSIMYVYILVGVALLILLIACATYINLSTARSTARAREVGVRKVIGAGRGQLFWQFIGESALVCGIAVLLSLTIAWLALPAFNKLTGRELPAGELLSLPFVGMSLLIGAIVSLLAGSYPALVLSGFQPVKVLKAGAAGAGGRGRGAALRQSLIVFQFVISVFLIVSTFVMHRQLHFIQNKKLGYEREHVLVLPLTGKMADNITAVKNRFLEDPSVLSLSRCASTPVMIRGGYNFRSSEMPAGEQHAVTANPVDEDYIRTTGLELVAGEAMTAQDLKDAEAVGTSGAGGDAGTPRTPVYHFILNESAARVLGWTPQQAIGKKMFLGDQRPGYVKGVVRDFHFQSLHQPIGALVLFPVDWSNTLLVKLSGQHLSQTIVGLGAKWKEMVPSMPFEYRFLDDDYNRLYSSEQRLGKVMNLFSLVAIVLACLGLFGLSAYAASQRIREIGIRKILGASLPGLVMLLSANFVRLALLAILIAFPLSWWVMSRWLADFSYRAEISVWIFLLSGLLVLVITLVTVSVQAMKAALANPVKNLRAE